MHNLTLIFSWHPHKTLECLHPKKCHTRHMDCLPCKMAEVAVCRACYDFTVNCLEFIYSVTEGNDFCRAHKCEVKWVEEEDEVFALVVCERDLFEVPVNDGCASPLWSRLGEMELRHGELKHTK